MKDSKKMKLTEIIKNKLNESELKKIKGGEDYVISDPGCLSMCIKSDLATRAEVKAF